MNIFFTGVKSPLDMAIENNNQFFNIIPLVVTEKNFLGDLMFTSKHKKISYL